MSIGEINMMVPRGWQCTVCGRVNNPIMMTCPCYTGQPVLRIAGTPVEDWRKSGTGINPEYGKNT